MLDALTRMAVHIIPVGHSSNKIDVEASTRMKNRTLELPFLLQYWIN